MNNVWKRLTTLTITLILKMAPGSKIVFGAGALLVESAQDLITAKAGGTQATATQLTAELNKVTTVTTAADAVKLPPSQPGLTILVVNKGVNPMQVFGTSPDTIDDVATATGVSQMPNSVVLYTCYAMGAWFTEGLATGYSGSLQTLSFKDAITAFATGGQGSAVQLAALINTITVCATSGDSVKLPTAAAGLAITVNNQGAASLNVFPATGDLINSLAINAAFAILPGQSATFSSTVALKWNAPSSVGLPLTQQTTIASGNGTLTGAQVAGASLVTLLTSGATAQTTPTAAQILAAIPNGFIGQTYRLRIVNTNAGTLTITADASVTATGTLTMATNTWREWDITITAAATATMKQVGTGTTS